jgi:N6-adenosine-specific RNA methylase IME4
MYALRGVMIERIMKKYNIILADPPWKFNNKNTGGSMISGSNAHYSVMSLNDLFDMPVANMAANDCVLFMWWVASQPREALAVVDAWGFDLKTMTGFNWIKKTKHDKDWFGMGFWTRAGSECCLIATRGKPKRASASVRSVTYALAQRHSQKPLVIHEKIVELMGDVPRLELFARQQCSGWDVWGNEVEGSVDLSIYDLGDLPK